MKRRNGFVIPILFAVLAASVLYAATTLTVQVQSTKLRQTPKFWGAVTATLAVGSKVTETKREGEWIQVKTASGQSGWLHASAVTTKNVQLTDKGGTVATGTSTKDVSMAGKGFNKEVEAEYAKNEKVDFAPVDAMSKITVSDQQLEEFLKSGRLAEWGTRP